MYGQFESGDIITFFCDGKSEKSGENKKRKQKSATEDADSAHGDHEQQIKKIVLELANMHGEKTTNLNFGHE